MISQKPLQLGSPNEISTYLVVVNSIVSDMTRRIKAYFKVEEIFAFFCTVHAVTDWKKQRTSTEKDLHDFRTVLVE